MLMTEVSCVKDSLAPRAEQLIERPDAAPVSKREMRMRAWVARELSDTIPAIADIAGYAGLSDLERHLRQTASVAAEEFRRLDFDPDVFNEDE